MPIKRLTIVTDDNLVIVDDFPVTMPLDLPGNIHAVQWRNGKGEIEYNDGTLNEPFTDLSRFQPIIDEHQRLMVLQQTPEEPTESELYSRLVGERNARLQMSDWIVLRNLDEVHLNRQTTLPPERLMAVVEYREELRQLPQTFKTSTAWVWPKEPKEAKSWVWPQEQKEIKSCK